MAAYYNEFDPQAAAWLRELIKQGHIADGHVDERSIIDVKPDDLKAFKQCHFFAGIGVWSYSLRKAGWSDDRPVWTGSCPCQPFSAAGKGNGFDDERHLWPHFHWLISQCRPDVVFGEQVASKDGLGWFDLVQADLEGSGYASGAVDTCAAGFGAPHIRQRLYWVGTDASSRMVNDLREGPQRRHGPSNMALLGETGSLRSTAETSVFDRLADPCNRERQFQSNSECARVQQEASSSPASRDGFGDNCASAMRGGHPPTRPTNGLWSDADWLFCRDGKWRPVEPGTFPLAHGAPARVGRLRGYGNAIVAEQAAAFVEAFIEIERDRGGVNGDPTP